MAKGDYKKSTDSIVPLRARVRDGKIVALLDHDDNEMPGAPVTAATNVTGRIDIPDLTHPTGISISGSQLETTGTKLWKPGDTLADGGGGTGTGSISVSDRADFSGFKITLDAGTANSKINADRTVALPAIASTDVIWVRFFIPAWAAGMEAALYLSSVANWTKFAFGGWSVNQLQEGINEVAILASALTLSGGEVFPLTPQKVRLQVKNTAGAGGVLYVEGIRVATSMPMCALSFDDGYADLIRYAYPIMAKNNLRGTAFVVPGWVDAQENGTMADNTIARWRDLQTLYDQGWDICPHTSGHLNALSYCEVGNVAAAGTAATFTGAGVSGDVVRDFTSGGQLVFDKPRGISFWSAGNDTGKLITITGIVNGQATIEKIMARNATFTTSENEWSVVSSVVMGAASAATVTIRAAYNAAEFAADVSGGRDKIIAQGMGRAANWFAWPRGEFSRPLRDALIAAGFNIRGTVETYTGNIFGGRIDRDFPSYSAGGARTLGDIQTFVGNLKAVGGIGSMFWHHVNSNVATPINCLPATLTTEIEWIAAEVYAGNLRCPTFSQIEKAWL